MAKRVANYLHAPESDPPRETQEKSLAAQQVARQTPNESQHQQWHHNYHQQPAMTRIRRLASGLTKRANLDIEPDHVKPSFKRQLGPLALLLGALACCCWCLAPASANTLVGVHEQHSNSLLGGLQQVPGSSLQAEAPSTSSSGGGSGGDILASSAETANRAPRLLAPQLAESFARLETTSDKVPNIPEQTTSTKVTRLETTTTTTTASRESTQSIDIEAEPEAEDERAPRDDADDAADCAGISAGQSAEAKNLSDHARLVKLQSCVQTKIRRKLKESRRESMEAFERLSLSGGCSASLLGLMTSLADLKSFAFKFFDASAKVPSGVMYGLLSDFGDFDQCLSIRSHPDVIPELESEEGGFSGKYCLANIRPNLRIRLQANETVPEGIIADGIFWDELIRNYWTSKSPKGFQVGVCVPSRCDSDDLKQIFEMVAQSYNLAGDISSCQDSIDLARQHKPDSLQRIVLYCFASLLALALLGTIVDRCKGELALSSRHDDGRYFFGASRMSRRGAKSARTCSLPPGAIKRASGHQLRLWTRVLLCFSLPRNWRTFVREPAAEACQQTATSTTTMTANMKKKTTIEKTTSSLAASHHQYSCAQLLDTSKTNTLTSTGSLQLPSFATGKQHALDGSGQDEASEQQQHRQQLELEQEQPPPQQQRVSLAHLSGLRLFCIIWITLGHSFLYPSANNYQYYRSIINMNITRDSIWFTTTNYTLGIDMLLYMTGLLFAYKLALSRLLQESLAKQTRLATCLGLARFVLRKIVRFWPTYMALIGFAIVIPLVSDGPNWPEMVSRRIGANCRRNWWSNLLFVNNKLNESEICLPSSWFVSVLMQLFLVGSALALMWRRLGLKVTLATSSVLIVGASLYTFLLAYHQDLPAPVIRMDESFVMQVDERIFGLYTNLASNLGPFLVGMLGGLLLARLEQQKSNKNNKQHRYQYEEINVLEPKWRQLISAAPLWPPMLVLAGLVLSSVLRQNYSPELAAVYWSLHRVGWSLVTGYFIHNCATRRWKLAHDFLALRSLSPVSRLIFIAYLAFPIYIHVHIGLVRDGLHVSVYNMFNIYITRLVMTFVTALAIHLLVELPFGSLGAIFVHSLRERRRRLSAAAAAISISDTTTSEKAQSDSATGGGSAALTVGPFPVDTCAISSSEVIEIRVSQEPPSDRLDD